MAWGSGFGSSIGEVRAGGVAEVGWEVGVLVLGRAGEGFLGFKVQDLFHLETCGQALRGFGGLRPRLSV